MVTDPDIVQVLPRDGVTLVRIRAVAILSEEQVEAFGQALRALGEVPGQRVVLSFLGVQQLTSQALGELIRLHKHLAQNGGKLHLADIDPRIYEIFSITRLDRSFRIFEREEEAVASFLGERGAEA